VITVTNVRGPSAYVHHSDHTVTEVSRSDAPQRLSHHTNLQLRTGLNLTRRGSCGICYLYRSDSITKVAQLSESKGPSLSKGASSAVCEAHS